MQVCTSLQTDNHASTPPLPVFYRPDALPAAQPTTFCKALKANTTQHNTIRKVICAISYRSLSRRCGWEYALLKRLAFSLLQNTTQLCDTSRTINGRALQVTGPETAKLQGPYCTSWHSLLHQDYSHITPLMTDCRVHTTTTTAAFSLYLAHLLFQSYSKMDMVAERRTGAGIFTGRTAFLWFSQPTVPDHSRDQNYEYKRKSILFCFYWRTEK